jgi:hypothetical protein
VTHLCQIMLEELRRRNYAESTIHAYIHTVEHFSRHFHRSPDQLGPEHIRQYQAALFTRWKLCPEHRNAAPGSLTLLLCSGVEPRLERCRDTISEEGSALTAGAEPERSRTSDRRGRVSLSRSVDQKAAHVRNFVPDLVLRKDEFRRVSLRMTIAHNQGGPCIELESSLPSEVADFSLRG